MIIRKQYLDKVSKYINDPLIKVILGQRRTGKSVLLQQIKDLYINYGYQESEIIYINKELPQFQNAITNSQELYEVVKSFKVILIDEIQDIVGRENTIRGLFATGGYQIVITGSNSNLLGGELATYLSGRYVGIYIGSYTLDEFMMAHNYQDPQKARSSYLIYGGAPYFSNNNFEKASEYHKMLLDTIIIHDISSRYDIRNIGLLQILIKYLASMVGGLFSATSITKYLKQQLTKISNTTITDYINFIKNSMIIHGVYREDIRGKRILEDQQKLYFTDHGLRNSLVGGLGRDNISGILENIVFNHLKIRGREITVGTDKQEIDFIAKKNGQTIYIQVAYNISNSETLNRELSALKNINDNRNKYIITMDDYNIKYSPIDGIGYHHIIDFCLGKIK